MAEVIGIDHIYVTVSDLARSERFYDAVMDALGFRKNEFRIGDARHVQAFTRHFGYSLRPARSASPHDPYAPGLHHFCFRVDTEADVRAVEHALRERGVTITGTARYPEYAEDYWACFFSDPDGVRLEVTNYRLNRRRRHDHWEGPW